MKNLTLKAIYTFRPLLKLSNPRPFSGTVLVHTMVTLSMPDKQLSPDAVEDRNSSLETTPTIFKSKCKTDKHEKARKQGLGLSYAGKIRHHPPAVNE